MILLEPRGDKRGEGVAIRAAGSLEPVFPLPLTGVIMLFATERVVV